MNDTPGSEMPRSEIDDLLGAYALDAVDPDEREVVERHLAADPAARAEVDEMRETAAVLASLPVTDERAPAELWDRIAGAIALPGETAAAADDAEKLERAPANVVPFALPKRSASIPMRLAVPIAAAAAIVIAVLAVQVASRTPNRVGDAAAAYNHALSNGAAKVPLVVPGGGSVAAEIALQADGTGYVRNDNLAPLPAGKTYQLWAVSKSATGQRVISAGVLGGEPGAAAFHVAGRPSAFAITVEDAPGVVTSTQTPAASGEVPT
jgi:Anti-sigma-K factor rskA/Putative zinc-finger